MTETRKLAAIMAVDVVGYLLKRPVGRPSLDVRRSYANFTYQEGSWTKPRRVVAKVERHPGESRVGCCRGHGRCVAFQMAEVAIPRNLFADVLRLIAELRPRPVASTA